MSTEAQRGDHWEEAFGGWPARHEARHRGRLACDTRWRVGAVQLSPLRQIPVPPPSFSPSRYRRGRSKVPFPPDRI